VLEFELEKIYSHIVDRGGGSRPQSARLPISKKNILARLVGLPPRYCLGTVGSGFVGSTLARSALIAQTHLVRFLIYYFILEPFY
jgi:hypothetical protein